MFLEVIILFVYILYLNKNIKNIRFEILKKFFYIIINVIIYIYYYYYYY